MNRPLLLLSLCLVFLGCFALSSAVAVADEVEVKANKGHVVAWVVVDTSDAAARSLLGTPKKLAVLEGRGADVTSRQEGGCIVSDVVAPSGVGKVTYTAKSCPVSDGFVGSLVRSKQIRQMDARWTLSSTRGGIRIEYDLFVVPKIRVPQGLVAVLAKRGVRRLVEAVRDELNTRARKP